MKWLKRYETSKPSLYKEVIKAKHGTKDNWCTETINASFGVGPWKYISELGGEFFQNANFKVGNGVRIKFWKDKWMNNTHLCWNTLFYFKSPQTKFLPLLKIDWAISGMCISEGLYKVGQSENWTICWTCWPKLKGFPMMRARLTLWSRERRESERMLQSTTSP